MLISTQALTNATLPFLLRLAAQGTEQAIRSDAALRKGLNLYRGHVPQSNVADGLGYPYPPPAGGGMNGAPSLRC